MKLEQKTPRTPLGQFILKRMSDLGLRQSDVARRGEMTPTQINRLLYGTVPKPQLHSHLIERLACALEVSVEGLEKFFPQRKSVETINKVIFASEELRVLLRTIEVIAGKPAADVLNESRRLEEFLKGVIKSLLEKEEERKV